MSDEIIQEQFNDDEQFIIPLVQMQNGQVAEIKGRPNAIYKDIPRNPFLRKTGVIQNGSIVTDIDITGLVRYGTLEQSRIAPTLENLDIHLYYKDSKDVVHNKDLHKFPPLDAQGNPDTTSIYADTYVWREVPAGLQLYNNDTVYGYDWVVLQDDYVGIDGVYNLHMVTEGGKGICKVVGSRGPMTLDNVDFMLVVTAKNLWNREFSLLEDFPLANSMDIKTDATAPTVAAIIDYYEKKVQTKLVQAEQIEIGTIDKEGNIQDPVLISIQEKDGTNSIHIKKLKVEDLEIDNKQLVYTEDLQAHIDTTVKNPAKDIDGNIVGVHGLLNTGFTGNVQAHSLDGATLSNGFKSVEKDVAAGSYIPFVDEQSTMGVGLHTKKIDTEGTLFVQNDVVGTKTSKTITLSETVPLTNATKIVRKTGIGASNEFNISYEVVNNTPTISLYTGRGADVIDDVLLKTHAIDIQEFHVNGNQLYPEDLLNSSSISLKTPLAELLAVHWDEVVGTPGQWELTPNKKTDVWGDEFKGPIQMPGLSTAQYPLSFVIEQSTENHFIADTSGVVKFGSALQALYELPMGVFNYTRDESHWKTQLGIFVERLNQYRDVLTAKAGDISKAITATGIPTEENYLVHKRNTLMQSKHPNILEYTKGDGNLYDSAGNVVVNDETSVKSILNREQQNSYTYTEEEIQSLVNYFNEITDKDELAQNIRCTVNILLKAAKETQERLLNVETSVYGWDAPTLPGQVSSYTKSINSIIDPALQTLLHNQPLFIGLNRAMRAVCLEVFNESELDRILAEAERDTTQEDSSGRLEGKPTIMSRMDKIDKLLGESIAQLETLKKYYIWEHENTHTYTPIVNQAGKEVVSEETTGDVTPNTVQGLSPTLGCHGTGDYDKDHQWKSLASPKDINTKNDIGFAEVSTHALQHTPDTEDCGILHKPIYTEENGKLVLKTKEAVIKDEDIKNENDKNQINTPCFKDQVVAWDSAKLERINQKLSEVTEAVYGVDDVVAKHPNRTEVLRRNINNLVDDLYPNRYFSVEQSVDGVGNLKLPFKNSKQTETSDNAVAVTWDENSKEKEPTLTNHTSIIPYFDKALFNFEIVNYYWKYSAKDGLTTGLINNNQITVGEGINSANLHFKTNELITDDIKLENFGTYEKAVSSVDLLHQILGTQNAFLSTLTDQNIWQVINGNSTAGLFGNNYAFDNDIIKDSYKKELTYVLPDLNDAINIVGYQPVASIFQATTTDAFLSRKSKPVIDRLTTIEATLDAWASWAQKNNTLLTTGWSVDAVEKYEKTKPKDPLKRFEDTNLLETLLPLSEKSTEQINSWFDLDIAMTDWKELEGVQQHNEAVFNLTKKWKFLYKTGYVEGSEENYNIKVADENQNEQLGSNNIEGEGFYFAYFKAPEEKEENALKRIKVAYISPGMVCDHVEDLPADATEAEKKAYQNTRKYCIHDSSNAFTIFVPYRKLNTLNIDFVSNNLTDAKIFDANTDRFSAIQNQTESLIYRAIHTLFNNLMQRKDGEPIDPKSLYYRMCLINHPVGSIYITRDNKEESWPEYLFGGNWKRIGNNTLLQLLQEEATTTTEPSIDLAKLAVSLQYKKAKVTASKGNTVSTTVNHTHSFSIDNKEVTTGGNSITHAHEYTPSITVGYDEDTLSFKDNDKENDKENFTLKDMSLTGVYAWVRGAEDTLGEK